jgi:hypothetical protein
MPDYRRELGICCHNLGILLEEADHPHEAEKAYREALALRRQLADKFALIADYQHDLAVTLGQLARFCHDRKDYRQALLFLDQAEPYYETALKANPRSRAYWLSFRAYTHVRALTLVSLSNHDQAPAIAAKLAQRGIDPARDLFNAACILAQCIAGAEKDPKLTDVQRRATAAAYARHAIEMLRQAAVGGYVDAAALKDTDLDPLRAQPDFQKLVAEVERTRPR